MSAESSSVHSFDLAETISRYNHASPPPRESRMNKPKVFVTRVIPAAGLDAVREFCRADVWTEPLPPPPDVLRQKMADCEGLLSLLTEKIDGAVMDAARRLRVISNYA